MMLNEIERSSIENNKAIIAESIQHLSTASNSLKINLPQLFLYRLHSNEKTQSNFNISETRSASHTVDGSAMIRQREILVTGESTLLNKG